jgi:FeS assembly SUF system protein
MKKIHVEGDPKLKNTGGKQYSMFVGRFQPFHAGHRWVLDKMLNDGKNVLICIRDIEPDENNPFTAKEVENSLNGQLIDLIMELRVKVMVIPDIESVNFGRGVGYDIIEHIPPQEVSEISATKIREQLKQNSDKHITERELKEKVITAIKTIYDPEIPVDVYELGLIYEVKIFPVNNVYILMTLTSPNCPVAETLPREVEEKIQKIDTVTSCEVEITFDPPWSKDLMSEEAKLELGML